MNPVGRNEPCPCGSGKRYKDCHGSLRNAQDDNGAAAPARSDDLRDAARKIDAGDIDGAEALLRKALAVHPRDAEALRLLGHCEHERGRTWEALRLALEAARAIPEAPVGSRAQFAIWTDLNAMLMQALWGLDATFAAAKRAEYVRWLESRSGPRRQTPPLVSIILVADEPERDLRTALASIQAQDYRNLELVVVAADSIAPQIAPLLAPLAFPSSVVSHPSAHRAVLLNAGLAASRGEFVNPLFGEDELGPERIGRMVETIADRGAAWGFSDVDFVETLDEPWDKRTRTRVERWFHLLTQVNDRDTVGFALIAPDCVPVTAANLFFSRALADRLGGFRALDHTYVWDFCLRAVWLDEPAYVFSRLLRHRIGAASLPNRVDFEAALVPMFVDYYRRACDEQVAAPNPFAPCLHHWRGHFLKAPFSAGHLLMLGLDRVEEIAAQLERRHEAQRARSLVPGIDLVGFAYAEFGLGESLRAFVRACLDAAIPFNVKDVDQRLSTRQTDHSVSPYIVDELSHRCALFCVNPDLLYSVQPLLEASSLAGGYKIGYWYWELDRVPEAWRPAFNRFDELWVATDFVAAAMRCATSMPVVKITPPIAVQLSRPYRRGEFSLPEDRFLFLFSFDFNSFPKRKNPQAAVTAFKHAFAARSDVGLVIKSINGKRHPELFADVEELVGGDTRIVMLDGFLSRDEVSGLQSVVDCFVSLHRSEGLGLGLAESMYLGKPVIGTRYSGNLEFMNDDNSCLVECRLVPVGRGDYLYDDERFRWAEPDIDQAAHYMRRLVDDVAFRERIARNGRDSIRSRFTTAATAALVRRRLDDLGFLRG